MILFMLRFNGKREKENFANGGEINEKLFVISNDYGIKVLSHPYIHTNSHETFIYVRGDKVAV